METVRECKTCTYFINHPHALEQALPGFSALSSARGSVRADTGLCQLKETFYVARDSCTDYQNKMLKNAPPGKTP
ncbi:hypothetical protein ACQZV8_09130 [Magnetococcales bacterium HHB-1]